MYSARQIQGLIVGLVVVVLVVSGPLVGLVDLTPANNSADTLGDGTANVTVSSLPTEQIRIDRGRFGTRVLYLRVPQATVDVHEVSDRPRLVYVFRVPALDFERVETRVLERDRTGQRTIQMDARAFPFAAIDRESYAGEVVVRVQSFESNRIVVRRNVTIPVSNRTWGCEVTNCQRQ